MSVRQQTNSRFREAVEAAGFKSQAELARKIRSSEAHVSRIARGLPPGPIVHKRLVRALGVDLWEESPE